jgi:hypothetical protein
MRHTNTLSALTALAAITSVANAATIDLAYNPFDTGIDGWSVRDTVNGNVTFFSPSWNAAGGMPDGHLEFSDITPGGYVFQGSQDFIGDFSSAANIGGVSFDWKANQIQSGKRAGVILWRDGVRLSTASDPDPAANVWHSFDFAFNMSSNWSVNYGSGSQTATMADVVYVLSNVTGMDITGETWTGMSETTWLDNPRLYTQDVPAPGALALLGVASIVGLGRRRRTNA